MKIVEHHRKVSNTYNRNDPSYSVFSLHICPRLSKCSGRIIYCGIHSTPRVIHALFQCAVVLYDLPNLNLAASSSRAWGPPINVLASRSKQLALMVDEHRAYSCLCSMSQNRPCSVDTMSHPYELGCSHTSFTSVPWSEMIK